MKKIGILAGLAFLAGCLFSSPEPSSAEPAGRFDAAAEYSRNHRGLSFLVVEKGEIVAERYHNGHTRNRSQMLASGTKSFSGVILAAAIEDGLISGFDEKVSDSLPSWRKDPVKAKITLRQLLNLTSGLEGGTFGRPPKYSDAVGRKLTYAPDTTFQYGPNPFQVFGAVMRSKLSKQKETVFEYLDRRILNPIGLEVADWKTREGEIDLPSGAHLTAREWSKFGLFLLNNGKWKGKQIVKKELLRELVEGSDVNPNYGITFWLNRDHTGKAKLPKRNKRGLRRFLPEPVTDRVSKYGIGPGLPGDVYVAAGFGNQRLYVVPSRNMVVVRQGRQGRFDDKRFLSLVLNGR